MFPKKRTFKETKSSYPHCGRSLVVSWNYIPSDPLRFQPCLSANKTYRRLQCGHNFEANCFCMTEKMSRINKFCPFNFRNIKCHALSKKLCVRSLRLCFEFDTSANKLCSMSSVWWHVNSCLWHSSVYIIVRGGMSLATFVCHQQNMWYLHIYLILIYPRGSNSEHKPGAQNEHQPNAENKGLIWWYDTGKFLYIQNPKKDQVDTINI